MTLPAATKPADKTEAKNDLGNAPLKCYNVNEPTISVDEYRRLIGDFNTPDELVRKRINFIEGLCRKTIRLELDQYHANGHKGK